MERMIIIALHMLKLFLTHKKYFFSTLDHDDVSKYRNCEIFNICFRP